MLLQSRPQAQFRTMLLYIVIVNVNLQYTQSLCLPVVALLMKKPWIRQTVVGCFSFEDPLN